MSKQVLAGEGLMKLGVSDERHASLHYCEQCKTFWEQYERYVDIIDEVDASRIYGQDTVSKHIELQSRFEPQNSLETSLVDSQSGRMPFKKFLEQLLSSEVFVLSQETANLNSFVPIQYERNGEFYVATFTSLERTLKVAEQFPHCLSIRASELLQRMSPEFRNCVESWMGCRVRTNGIWSRGDSKRLPALIACGRCSIWECKRGQEPFSLTRERWWVESWARKHKLESTLRKPG